MMKLSAACCQLSYPLRYYSIGGTQANLTRSLYRYIEKKGGAYRIGVLSSAHPSANNGLSFPQHPAPRSEALALR